MPREWKPDLHPRGHGGKFVSKGGGKGSAAAALSTADQARKKASNAAAKAKSKAEPETKAVPKPKVAAQRFRRFSGVLEPDPKPKVLVLSKAERTALYRYTGNENVSMNDYLTGNRKVRGPARKDLDYVKHVADNVEALEALVKRSDLPKPLAVTRAIPDYIATKVFGPVGSKARRTFIDKRFVSTTTDPTPNHAEFGPVLLRYNLKAGARALNVSSVGEGNPREKEVIVAPGRRFRVLTDQIDTHGRRVIELETA